MNRRDRRYLKFKKKDYSNYPKGVVITDRTEQVFCWLHDPISEKSKEKYRFTTSILETIKMKENRKITVTTTYNICPVCSNTVQVREDEYAQSQ